MRIEIVGDDSIGHQARIYAEYRLFAALSQAVDTRHVRAASLVLSRATNKRQTGDDVVCAVTLEMHNGEIERLRGAGAHPYAAINAVVGRLRPKRRTGHHHTLEEEREIREAALDQTIAGSFPASDPPSSVPNPDDHAALER